MCKFYELMFCRLKCRFKKRVKCKCAFVDKASHVWLNKALSQGLYTAQVWDKCKFMMINSIRKDAADAFL